MNKDNFKDYLDSQLGNLDLNLTPMYNSFDDKEKKNVIWIYSERVANNEMTEITNITKGLEFVANLYHKQKCAFEDILTQNGFEPTSDVLRDYEGRIGILTAHGTLVLLGKYRENGRTLKMTRIHTPGYNIDGSISHLLNDLSIGKEGPKFNRLHCSETRALAINPYGTDDDCLENNQFNTIIDMIVSETLSDIPISVPVEKELEREIVLC